METNRLRQFRVVAKTGNLRKAAEILKISHSALSKSMKVLQQELNRQLITAEGRNITITDEGKAFLIKVEHFLSEEVILTTQDSKVVKPLRIGTFEVFSTHFLGTVWTRYFKDRCLDLHELLPGRLEESVANHKIDLGITYEPIPVQGVDFIKIGKIEMHVFKRDGSFRTQKTADLPFVCPVTPISGTPTGMKGLDGWPEDKIPRTVLFRVDMMESGLALARSGVAAIFAPSFVIHFHNRSVRPEMALVKQKLPEGMNAVWRDVFVVKRNSYSENADIRTLAKLLRTECLNH